MLMDILRDKMKLIIYIVVIAFVGGGTLVYLNQGNTGGNQSQVKAQESAPAATVNGEEISGRAFQQQLSQILQQNKGQIAGPQKLQVKQRVLDQLTNQELIEQEMESRGLTDEVSDEEVEKILDKQIESSQYESKEEIENAGIPLDQIRDNIKRQLAMQKLVDQVLKDAELTDEEIEDIEEKIAESEDEMKNKYEKVNASHILIRTEDKSDEEAKAKAEEVLEELKSGEDFAAVAKEHSEGPSAKQGGQLNGFSRDSNMIPEFKEAAFELEEGEVSNLVKTKHGYHIIKVNDVTGAKESLLEEKKEEKKNKAFSEWLSELKEEAEIVIKDNELRGYQAQQDENYDEAVKSYKAALENDGADSYVYHYLAHAYKEQDKNEKAVETYQEAIKENPEDIQFHKSLQKLYEDLDQNEKAKEQEEKVKELEAKQQEEQNAQQNGNQGQGEVEIKGQGQQQDTPQNTPNQ
ncbi:MAG: peptidylprolyl isomerase [Bacillota bacterium]